MKTSSSQAQALPTISGAKITILQARWHADHTDRMVSRCRSLLTQAGAGDINILPVPGSLELPIAALSIATQPTKPDAIICFGAVLKGETYHFELVANEATRGLMRVSLDHDIPIIMEVLAVYDLDQLIARSGDDDMNKGIEAAHAAAEIIALRHRLKQ